MSVDSLFSDTSSVILLKFLPRVKKHNIISKMLQVKVNTDLKGGRQEGD